MKVKMKVKPKRLLTQSETDEILVSLYTFNLDHETKINSILALSIINLIISIILFAIK